MMSEIGCCCCLVGARLVANALMDKSGLSQFQIPNNDIGVEGRSGERTAGGNIQRGVRMEMASFFEIILESGVGLLWWLELRHRC
jgi:hypothetical protein